MSLKNYIDAETWIILISLLVCCLSFVGGLVRSLELIASIIGAVVS